MKRLIFLLAIVTASCSSQRHTHALPQPSSIVTDGKIWSSLFQQRAAEYQALCLQAFNIASERIEALGQQQPLRPRAVITDIDETFLDNSPYAVQQALSGRDYDPVTWADWTTRGIADTLPGALAFFRKAARHAEIFYITNRDEKERGGTLKNLQRFGFPNADNEHLLMRQNTSGKESRRQKVAASFDIVLLLGDNLSDFSDLFDKKTVAERTQNVMGMADAFGKKFIVLPNTNYGGWEDAIYLNQRNWTPAQKDSLIKAAVHGYR